MSRCVYTSFFTPDYLEPAAKLIESLHAHELDYDIPKVPDTGKWISNCAAKPKFIYEMLQRYSDRPVVWTDADSVLKQKPLAFEFEETSAMRGHDAAVCEYTWRRGRTETLSGTLWFGATDGAKRLADIWAALQIASPREMDQQVLARAVMLARAEGIKVAVLPVEYCFIFDLHKLEHPDAKPVFEHFQHSRERKLREVAR